MCILLYKERVNDVGYNYHGKSFDTLKALKKYVNKFKLEIYWFILNGRLYKANKTSFGEVNTAF